METERQTEDRFDELRRKAAAVLAELQCDVLQGFYFAPPLPLREFCQWVASRAGPRDAPG